MSKNAVLNCYIKSCCFLFLLILFSITYATEKAADDRYWKTLDSDELHDKTNPALEELQQPSEALKALPADVRNIGNQVDWVRALNLQIINPRSRISEDAPMPVWDVDIIMPDTAGTPMVRFPHKAHTDWLDCSNCHPKPFIKEFNANPIDMLTILKGDYCGQCHGAVSFPLTECRRCHSVLRENFTGKIGPQPPPAKIFPPVKEQKAQ